MEYRVDFTKRTIHCDCVIQTENTKLETRVELLDQCSQFSLIPPGQHRRQPPIDRFASDKPSRVTVGPVD
jgi:hypothetical protein